MRTAYMPLKYKLEVNGRKERRYTRRDVSSGDVYVFVSYCLVPI